MSFLQTRSQPRLLQRAYSNTPTPSAIEKVIPRTAIDLDDGYFPWATDFALLKDAYAARVVTCAPTGPWVKMYPGNPPDNGGNRHYRNLGNAQARIDIDYLQPAGWIIELIHEDIDDADARILTVVRGNMPVLCPTFGTAMQLAEASYPNCHYNLCWRSVLGPRTRITDVPIV
jgi:hypothetical protein